MAKSRELVSLEPPRAVPPAPANVGRARLGGLTACFAQVVPWGILSPKPQTANGRQRRVSHRIKVIVDSNDMPVMRSHRVATEMVVLLHKTFPNYRICSRPTLAGPARSGGRSGDEAQRLAQWFQRLEVMIEAPIRCCGTQGSTGRPGTAGRQLASRADQTTERGLWARAYRGSNWLLSRPSTAGELPRAM